MAALEQKKSYFVSKDFRGLNNKNNRTAIQDNDFAWLENAQPIGFGNIKIVNAPTNVANVAFANTVTYLASANINNDEYVFAFQEDGSAQYVNVDTNTQGNLAAANTFSNANVQIAQWKNDRILIIDPNNGYKTWDGTNLNSIGSVGLVTINNGGANYVAPTVTFDPPGEPGGVTATGEAILVGNSVAQIIVTEAGYGYTSAPTITITDSTGSGANVTCVLFNQNGTSIATFSGRTWISDARTVYYSAADTFNDFTSVSSGFLTITDSTLRTDISGLVSANNFLYVFGQDSINVFSDVRINSTTGETIFTNTNVSASIGSSQKYAIFPYFRSMLFINRYGIYALVGATTSKISDDIDGLIEIVDFTEPITGGQVLVNNILCAAWTFTIDENGTKRKVQAVFFDRKWFLTNQGSSITRTVSSVQGGNIVLYGTTGTDLIKFYQDSTSGIEWEVITALWPMGDPIRDKQALKVGVEATFGTAFANMDVYIDSESQQSPPIFFQNSLSWVNNVGNVIPWVNTSGTQIGWISNTIPGGNSYYLYRFDARMYGKYLGLTLTGTTPPFTINGFQLEHELRARF
jgi:acyl-coenzyme A thioesterase PaaI-like protein